MNIFFVFLKGFAMGAANVIPGVSGGTVAFITGIYERLINAIKAFDIKAIKLLKNREFTALLKHVDFSFLAALCLGVIVSIATMAKCFNKFPIKIRNCIPPSCKCLCRSTHAHENKLFNDDGGLYDGIGADVISSSSSPLA